MNLRKQRKDLVTGHHNPQPHKWNKESMGLWRCAVAVLVRYEAIIGELLRRASYEAEAEAARSAEASAAAAASAAAVAVAVAEEDTVLDRSFAGDAFRGGSGAAAWTAEAASHSSKSPLSSIRRSVLELCSDLFNLTASPPLGGEEDDKEEGQRRIRT